MAVRLLPPQTPEQAGLTAWGHVAVGYEAALKVPGLDDEDRGSLLRQLRDANELASRAHVTVAGGGA